MLTVQYRMHERIMDWSSKELYNRKVLRASLDGGLSKFIIKSPKVIRFDCIICFRVVAG